MDEFPDNMPMRKIYEQNQNKQVRIENLEITGDLGAGVIIQSSQTDLTLINISGSAIAGDAYQVVSRSEQTTITEIDEMIEKMDADAETHDHLKEAVEELRAQVKEGERADIAMVNYLLNWIGEISPELLKALAQLIDISPEAGEEVKMLAQQTSRRLK